MVIIIIGETRWRLGVIIRGRYPQRYVTKRALPRDETVLLTIRCTTNRVVVVSVLNLAVISLIHCDHRYSGYCLANKAAYSLVITLAGCGIRKRQTRGGDEVPKESRNKMTIRLFRKWCIFRTSLFIADEERLYVYIYFYVINKARFDAILVTTI